MGRDGKLEICAELVVGPVDARARPYESHEFAVQRDGRLLQCEHSWIVVRHSAAS